MKKKVSLTIDEDLLKEAEELCVTHRRNLSNMMSWLIARGLGRPDSETPRKEHGGKK